MSHRTRLRLACLLMIMLAPLGLGPAALDASADHAMSAALGEARAPGAPPRFEAQPVVELTFGTSLEGRPISGTRIGAGPRALWLVGGTHGAPEANTYELLLALADHFRAHPDEVPPSVRLYIVPTVNPDGHALGWRFNAAFVDLNRNMDTSYDACPENDWNPVVQGAGGVVSETGGAAAESEVEAGLVREMLQGAWGVVFYHSDGGVVFPAFCEHAPSIALAQVYAEASGYAYNRYWQNYMITGGMHDWAGSLGIASITPELFTGVDTDFEQNLAAVRAVLARPEQLLPAPAPVTFQSGIEVPALLWRYWRSHGGAQAFGEPISPALLLDGAIVQHFEGASFALRPERLETLDAVVMQPEGSRAWADWLAAPPQSPFQLR